MGKYIAFLYGVVSYLVFLASFLYAIGFVGNLVVPISIDSGGQEASFGIALLINAVLLGLFAVQHMIMARPGFKRWWTGFIPKSVERSTFVLFSSLLLLLLFWQWRPIGGPIWAVEHPTGHFVLQALFWIGWVTVLISTFMINHFDLFGLRQVYVNLCGDGEVHPEFKSPGLYKIVRHPIMVGFIIAFWATPTMTLGHLIFAIATTAFIMISVRLEERDLVGIFGKDYEEYQQSTRMFIPLPKGSSPDPTSDSDASPQTTPGD
jgi:protein-S-isoprenylcysteine O-methyltransferase Ste14